MPTERFDDMFNEAMKDPEMAELIHEYITQMTAGIQPVEAWAGARMSADRASQQSEVAKMTVLE